jgi:hypothetical protein
MIVASDRAREIIAAAGRPVRRLVKKIHARRSVMVSAAGSFSLWKFLGRANPFR